MSLSSEITITAGAAFDLFRANCAIVEGQCESLSCQPCEISEKTTALLVHCRELEKSAKVARQAAVRAKATEIAASASAAGEGLLRVEGMVEDLQPDELRTLASDVLALIGEGIVTLTARGERKCTTVALCSTAAIAAGYHAGNIVRETVSPHGGSGGGRPEFAMGGYALRP
jgi:alanyl-tRNA synthetase